jgi:hypothetical protein
MTVADNIAGKLGGKPVSTGGYLVPCPVPNHGKGEGDRNPSCLIRDGDRGGISIRCFAGCSSEEIRAELARRGLLATRTAPTTAPGNTKVAPWLKCVKLWRAGRDANDTIVERYLRARKLVLAPEIHWHIKYHPALWVAEEQRTRPGMIVLLKDIETNEPCGIIRTFLNPEFLLDDLAYDPRCKLGRKMLGRAKHAAVKLANTTGISRLTVGEGFETAIASWQLKRTPTWALGSADAIRWFPVINEVEELTILRENNHAGRAAAQACANRWIRAGKRVLFWSPPPQYDDHADMLLGGCNYE